MKTIDKKFFLVKYCEKKLAQIAKEEYHVKDLSPREVEFIRGLVSLYKLDNKYGDYYGTLYKELINEKSLNHNSY